MKRSRGRRSIPDPLAPIRHPTWLVVRDHRTVVEVTPLEPHADLRAILNAAREARMADGWACDEIGRSCSFFYCAKDGRRRLMVTIECVDPAVPRSPLPCYEFFSRRR